MAVEIGINPSDYLPELGGDISPETCLCETRAAGYAGTDLGGTLPRRVGQTPSAASWRIASALHSRSNFIGGCTSWL